MAAFTRHVSLLVSAAVMCGLSAGSVRTAEAAPERNGTPILITRPIETQIRSATMPIQALSFSHGVSVVLSEPVNMGHGAQSLPDLRALDERRGRAMAETVLVDSTRGLRNTSPPPRIYSAWQRPEAQLRARPLPVRGFTEAPVEITEHSSSSVFALMKAMTGGIDALVETAQIAKASVPDIYGDGDRSMIPDRAFFTGPSFLMILVNFLIQAFIVAMLFHRRAMARYRHRGFS